MATQQLDLSKADLFRALPADEQRRRINLLTDDQSQALIYEWDFWRRPKQCLPETFANFLKTYWLILAGRGFGKTRVGAETVREWAKDTPLVNLIGATADDARDIMIEGESGILACCPDDERPEYQVSKRRLVWPNGSISLIFTADEPERLRGKQHYKLWADEMCAWRYPEAWEQAQFGLRLGANPQAVVTTTPKPVKHLIELMKDPATIVTRGSTYENRGNLAKAFFTKIVNKYEGTRLGRQELKAEVLLDNPNALWNRGMIENHRVKMDEVPALFRVVVAIDPAVTSNADSDETGIVCAGRDGRSPAHFYIFEDASGIYTPKEWASKAIYTLGKWQGDRIVGEVNNGGDLIEATLRNVNEQVPYKAVRASRGKIVRAEPIAALYEQGRVHHVGLHAYLEDQMCDYVPGLSDSPDRMDANVWALTELSEQDEVEMVVVDDSHRSAISKDLDAFEGHEDLELLAEQLGLATSRDW